jgi:hypothetical protein
MVAQAKAAGFKGTGLALAVAVSLAEDPTSNPNAVNHNANGTTDRGYWQINSVHGALSTFDPAGNARAAYTLSKAGSDWSAWTTAHNGRARLAFPSAAALLGITGTAGQRTPPPAYQQAMVAANRQFSVPLVQPGSAVSSVVNTVTDPINAVTGAAKSTAEAASSALGFLGHAAAWTANPHNWLRVVEVIGGTAAVLLGLKMLADSGVGGPVGAVASAGAHVAHSATHVAKTAAAAAAL